MNPKYPTVRAYCVVDTRTCCCVWVFIGSMERIVGGVKGTHCYVTDTQLFCIMFLIKVQLRFNQMRKVMIY